MAWLLHHKARTEKVAPHTWVSMQNKRLSRRFGLHYFPDGEHYRQQDLFRWLPIMQRLGISCLTMIAPPHRAIPEHFVRGLLEHNIQPILHFATNVDQQLDIHELKTLIHAYADWGVRHIAIFDRPNLRLAWQTANWAQNRLVEHFLDRYIPLARLLIGMGIAPIFPPLEPGGDYWDTTFLRFALQSLERRGETRLLDRLILGAYGYRHDYSWMWGKGGPERWPGARPYLSHPKDQDQRGFYIFDWYAAISRAVLSQELPVFLLRAGASRAPLLDSKDRKNTQDFLEIYQALLAAPQSESYQQLPDSLSAVCLWLISAETASQYAPAALFSPDGSPLPAGAALLHYGLDSLKFVDKKLNEKGNELPQAFPLSQYVLIPRERENPIVNQLRKLADPQKVAFGSSFLDAALARQVIVFGQPELYPAQQINLLARAGCEVITCGDSGTELARMLVTQ